MCGRRSMSSVVSSASAAVVLAADAEMQKLRANPVLRSLFIPQEELRKKPHQTSYISTKQRSLNTML